MFAARAAALSVAIWLALGAADMAAAACKLEMIAEYPVVMHGAEPLIDASIDGHPASFLVDTGSSTTVITRGAAQQLGLRLSELKGVTFYGVGGRDGASTARIRDLKIGTASAHNVDIVVTGRIQAGSFMGLLGADFLARGDLELDFANGVIRQFKPKGCQGDEVVYWNKPYALATIEASNADSSMVTLGVSLNGRRVVALLDTGADRSTVAMEAARRAGVTPRSQGVKSAGSTSGMGGAVETWVATFDTLSVGDEKIQNAELELADMFSKTAEVGLGSHIAEKPEGVPEMLLGADFVRAHRIYVARSQGKVYFSYNGGQIFQLPQDSAPAEAPKK